MKHTFTFKNTKKLFALLGLLLFAATSCKKKDDTMPVRGTAYIEVVNASQTDAPIDFFIGSTKKNTQPTGYTQSISYFSIDAGQTLPASIKVSSTGNTLVNMNLTPLPNVYYSIFYFGGLTTSYVDDLTTVADKARVRFINLNKGETGNLDYGIKNANVPLVTNLGPAFDSVYCTVTAGSTFSVYATGTTNSILDIPTTIQAGHVYTIFLSGETTSELQATVLQQK